MKKPWRFEFVVAAGLVSVGIAVAAFIWALRYYPVYVGTAILVIVLYIVANQPRLRRERERIQKLIDTAFTRAYAELSFPPSVVRSWSYGYPAFEVKFRSKVERDAAAHLNSVFKAEIGKIFEGHGPRGRPFNADQGVFFTYEGYLEELRAYHGKA